MSLRRTINSALFIGSLSISGIVGATPNAEALANTCVGCHGSGGASQGPTTPSIAGMSGEYFIDTMKAFRGGQRHGTIMNRIAKGYNDEEIARMAAFFSKQAFFPPKQEYDVAKANAGAALHEKYCEKCHPDGGRSDDDGMGRLAGQWVPYLRFSFADYLSGVRKMPREMARRVETMRLRGGDDTIEDLLNYYARQGEQK